MEKKILWSFILFTCILGCLFFLNHYILNYILSYITPTYLGLQIAFISDLKYSLELQSYHPLKLLFTLNSVQPSQDPHWLTKQKT